MMRTSVLLLILLHFANGQVTVMSPAGTIEGRTINGVDAFLGIPYATIPERFHSSKLLTTSNDEMINATEFGPWCIQATFPGAPVMEQSEDCLSLNIWRPTNTTSDAELTTMVWIHGGGFNVGAGSEPLYDGAALARDHGVVVVTLNYRLGVFGFLANATEDGKGGMNGINDQINALQWVNENIASFGGNPNDVTIFGESAGGVSVCILAVSPLAQSLFQRVIIQSGQCISDRLQLRSAQQGAAATQSILNQTGVSSVDELKTLPAEDLVFGPNTIYLSLDGWVLSEQPKKHYQEGNINAQDFLIGSTTYDDASMLGFPPEAYVARANSLDQYIHGLFDARYGTDASDAVIQAYSPRRYNGSQVAAFAQFNGDFMFTCSSRELAAMIAGNIEGKSFLYTFAHFFNGSDIGTGIVGLAGIQNDNWASHTAEIPFVFGNLGVSYGGPVFVPPSPQEIQLKEEIMARWVNFAKSGNPNVEGSGDWTSVPQAGLQSSEGASEVSSLFLEASGGEMELSDIKVQQCSTIPGVVSYPSSQLPSPAPGPTGPPSADLEGDDSSLANPLLVGSFLSHVIVLSFVYGCVLLA